MTGTCVTVSQTKVIMSHHIIDRRKNAKGKSSGNRQRFLRRVRNQVKQAAKEAIRGGDIKSITSNQGRKVKVPVKDLNQPRITHGEGGVYERVIPGNREYIKGRRFDRESEDESNGTNGEGEDNFEFTLTKEEFLDLFFEDLELPDLVKKNITVTDSYTRKRSGFGTQGTPSRLNVIRSMRQAKSRRFALGKPKRKKIKELEAELEQLLADGVTGDRISAIEEQIAKLKKKLRAVPFVDDVDLRYNMWTKEPQPASQAVMFCIMDVSGSMGEWEKEMAKRFFMLLYLFLTKAYDRVELVFIRHHHDAKEVDEKEFFYSQDSGGTLVSPALDLMDEIIKNRYPTDQWNVYGCQASDGDNFPHDTPAACDTLNNTILPKTQYYAYVEIDRQGSLDSDLWDSYDNVRTANKNFDMTVITDVSEIYPVFRRLFEKNPASATK